MEGVSQEKFRVHWYTPVNKTIRGDAAEFAIEKYASATFGADLVAQGKEISGGRPRLDPDLC